MNSNQNQPSPIIENIISQTHALLLFKIFKEIDQIFVDPIQDLAKKKFNIAFIKYQSIDSGISEAQLEKTLNILQKKIVNASSNSFHFVITKFMPILEVDPNRISQSKKMKPKVILPSTQDATETIEDRKDNTSKYFILNTFYLCLEKIKEEKSVDEYQVISQEIIESITDHLDLIYSTAVRYIAGQCLGGLTEYDDHFKLISTLLLEKVKPTSKKTERVAVTYEKALKYLKYGIANSVQANLTLIFLNNYAKNLRKIERGVHRKEACKTISQIFQKIFPKKSDTEDVKKKKKLILTNLKSAYVTLFENLLSSLDQCYKTVLKWSKKAKHMVFSYQCLIELLDFLQFKLINEDEKERAKIRDLLATISNSMKNNTNLRLQYLELAYQFYQHLSIEFIEVDSKNFQFMTKTFSVFLLPNMTKKMSQINQQEVNLIASIIEEMGSKKLDLTIEIIMEMMKHLDLRLDYKIALLKGLGMLTETHYEDVSKKKELFGLVANFLLETRKYIHFTFSFAKEEDDANYLKNIGYAQIQINEQLVSAAMSTFPCVLSTKDDENMKISRNLIELTLHDNREISNFAILGLQKMVSKDENQSINFFNFIFKFILEIFGDVGYFIDVNNKIQDNFATFLKLSQVMSLIIGSFQESLKTNKNIIRTITLEIWQALRIQFEGCCMLWLSIPEVWIGMEISRLMSTFHNQEFIQFEKLLIENEKKHRKENDQKIDSNLEISFLAEKCVNQLENLNRDQLVVFIHTNYLEHKFAFNWAWNLLAHYFIKARNIDIVFTTVDPYAEILRLIWNQFVYLCASVSIPEEDIPHLVLENIPQTRETGPIKGRRKTKVKSEEDMNSMSKVTRSDTMERSPQIHDGSNQGDLESLQDREKKSFDGKTELDSPTPFMATKTELFNPKHNTLLLKHFFNIAYRLVRTEKENIRTEAINSLVKMQSSSFEIFLSIVVDHEKQMGFGDNENKLEDFKIMEIPFYLKSYIVTLTARFLTQCQTELFGSLPRLNRLINELMLKWMASEEIAQMDSIHMHNIEQIMQIVRAYFEKLLEFSQQKIARKEADNLVTAANSAWIENQENMTALFLFLLEMLSESTLKKITNQEKKKLILGDSINTLSILMMFYQSHNQEMENRLLIGCAKVLSMGSMIYPDVKRVLVTFLQNNPAYFEAYFRYSFDLMCDDEFLKLKALCFFESLVINFTSDPIKWIENVGIPIHKLIALILIHVNNPEKPVRSLVHHLIISLSELKTDDKIHPGKDNLNALSAITHPNMHIYCNLSSGYFDSVSTIYSQMTPQILMEVAKFYKKFNYDMKYKVMELLIFWTRNYAAFLQTSNHRLL
ncbi:hypothetical protein M0811_08461 [Anaeramoeba ignava]|uniref:Uncharacterized protein n=1 Tax=Anaeramoeba ignava TaxID=1746090 RepID=A0A9Q0LJL8_ANAIG|nr:hypothetical protein M0811_08461 [Anaeramoeba ignava]